MANPPWMDLKTGRPSSLLLELPAATVTIDDERIDLPPTELELLTVLASRPGEVVSHKDLSEATFIPSHDIHWRIHKLRDLIGDKEREHKLVANRRGQGYMLDMAPRNVRVLDHVAENNDEAPGVVDITEPLVAPASEEIVPEEVGPGRPEQRRRARRRVALIALGALGVTVALGGSWVAGYVLSQRGTSTPPATVAEEPPGRDAEAPTDRSDDRKKVKKKKNGKTESAASGSKNQAAGEDTVLAGPAQPPSDPSDSSAGSTKPSGNNKGSESKTTTTKPVPPQPDVRLYHLVHPDGDHYMTVSSAAANEKQAAGYSAAVEGRAYSKQVQGTIAITLDDGATYVYRSRESVPEGLSATDLYRLVKDGDYFYTSSSSVANQAEAQGWARSVVGAIVT